MRADFASDPALFAELEAELGGPYRPWSTAVHDGGREAEALAELTEFLDHHLKAVAVPDGSVRVGPVHVRPDGDGPDPARALARWDPAHRAAKGRDLGRRSARGSSSSGGSSTGGSARSRRSLPPDTALMLMSDHGFGPIEWYVNFNVWLLERGDIALQDSFYVKQKQWFYDRGVTPAVRSTA